MTQEERRLYLIQYLLDEDTRYKQSGIASPESESEQKALLRGLMNLREPRPISEEFLRIQDEYLTEIAHDKGVVWLSDLHPLQDGIFLWQGDITRLAVDAIVNAANSGMTGCYQPNHNCIDNCIHTYAGVQLRLACSEIIRRQGHEEPTGKAKITPAFNLPCKHVLHTVGPIIYDKVRSEDEALLASCYQSCLELAAENHLQSIAFCCISTGVFCFPNEQAAEIAVRTVQSFITQLAQNGRRIEVVFNVFKDVDKAIYERLLNKTRWAWHRT